ncbi:Hypothetical protein R9X50_00662100 [Acrodontium crateriforme]|uniref:Translation initiation factor eIF2B subunit beta n=1 Tax=Acrodontium crateriforme TaxID=150365 RepID=A0AAQ3MAE7_9PEZI|nr:Hypothetical protein R9X50_00662100 [Acrodontium crateriforme]
MPAAIVGQTPSLSTFLKSLKTNDVETSTELLISLLKRRQIRNSRPCAIATSQLLLRVVAGERHRDAQKLIERIRNVGCRLVAAQPREMAVGNIVRRILGVVREVAEEDQNPADMSDTSPTKSEPSKLQSALLPTLHAPTACSTPGDVTPSTDFGLDGSQSRPSLHSVNSHAPGMTSLFNILQTPQGRSPIGTPPGGAQTPNTGKKGRDGFEAKEKLDVKAEVIDGIKELIDELEIVDSQIAESALDHIHSNETILTHTSSQTVQRFLMTAARKRKFTVIHAEAYPNDHEATHATIVNGGKKGSGDNEDVDERWRPLTAMGITVILIPDSAVFALMSRINKVILAPHTVMANGSLLAAAGASTIAQTAKVHHVPVVVLSGVYKLCPVYPFDTDGLIEYGDPSKVVPFQDGEFMDKVDVVNPIYDFVDSELVDLYITNLGGHAPSFLYRIVADHYRPEDIDLRAKSDQ